VCERKQSALDPEVIHRMAEALQEEYVRKRRLYLRVLPNALEGTARAGLFQAAFAGCQSEAFGPGESYRTLVLDLSPPLEELRKRLDQKWRNQLNRAERNGLTLVEGEEPEKFQVMVRMFREMRARKQFSQSSDLEEFGRMQEQLPPSQRMRVLICEDKGVPVAGAIVTAIGDSGIYLFGATSDQGLAAKGSYLLQWRFVQWLKESGKRSYNLGGINPETNPGVYHFKKGLSGQDVLYLTPRIACDSVLSAALARVARISRGRIRNSLNGLLQRERQPEGKHA
jgi:lipid II:glycine glycyltransferase (peptidoglycan interpeptide bridge formation enzyme)